MNFGKEDKLIDVLKIRVIFDFTYYSHFYDCELLNSIKIVFKFHIRDNEMWMLHQG